MNTIGFVFLCLISTSCFSQEKKTVGIEKFNRVDSLLISKLKSLDKESFKGKTVEVLLTDSIAQKFQSYYFIDEPTGTFNRMELYYSKNVYLIIKVKDHKHTLKFNPRLDWSLEDFKKETILSVELSY